MVRKIGRKKSVKVFENSLNRAHSRGMDKSSMHYCRKSAARHLPDVKHMLAAGLAMTMYAGGEQRINL